MLFFKLSKNFLRKKLTQNIVTLIFSFHPVHVESICNITNQSDLLASLFHQLTLLTVFNNSLQAGIVYALCGLLAKETVVLTLFVAILFTPKTDFQNSLSTLTFAGCFLGCRFQKILHSPEFSSLDNGLESTDNLIIEVLSVWVKNIELLIFPNFLCHNWTLNNVLLNSKLVLGLWVCLVFLILKIIKSDWNVMRLVIWGGLNFLPFSHLSTLFGLKSGFLVAERLLYATSIPFLLLIGYAGEKINKHCNKFLIILMVCYFSKSSTRIQAWENEKQLYRTDLKCGGVKTTLNYLQFVKNLTVQENLLNRLLVVNSTVTANNYISYYYIGQYLEAKNDTNLAKKAYKTSLELNPLFIPAVYDLAKLSKDTDLIITALNFDPELTKLSEVQVESYKRESLQIKKPTLSMCDRVKMIDWRVRCYAMIPDFEASCYTAVYELAKNWSPSYDLGLEIAKYCRRVDQTGLQHSLQIYEYLLENYANF